ncbi:MAG: dihydroneopterin aldolase [Cardiobacteriaceae bacterium]|nr:dihydroneopterin aldolase [Cardiobacteriaceae bacterium]
MQDIIYIHAIKVRTVIGILPHERIMKQTLIINCELGTDTRIAGNTDNIEQALDYAAICDFIIRFADKSHYGLIEAFAENLVTDLFAHFPAKSIQLDVQKPGALEATRHVGLRIYRERN